MNKFTNIFVGLLLVLIFGGLYVSTFKVKEISTVCYAFPEEYVKVFYLDNNVEYWLVKEELLAFDVRYVMDKLILDDDLGIPNHTVVNDIYIQEMSGKNILYIDLSSNFEIAENGGGVGETQVMRNIDCIVNTFCLNQGFEVDAVQFYFDGEILDNMGGVVTDDIKYPTVKLFKHGAENQ